MKNNKISPKVFEDSLNSALDECVARENELSGNSEQLKMPVVGKRYTVKGSNSGRVVEVIAYFKNKIVLFGWHNDSEGRKIAEDSQPFFYDLEHFFEILEELPESQEEKPVSANNAQVEKAKEQLKHNLNLIEELYSERVIDCIGRCEGKIYKSAKNLLNALDTQINQQTAETLRNSQEGKGLIKRDSVEEALDESDDD